MHACTRRKFLAAVVSVAATARSQERAAGEACARCGGTGLLPLPDAKAFVWVSGSPPPKPETAVGKQHCPQCHPGGDPAELVAAAGERLQTVQQQHATWEERLGGKLLLCVTRHAAFHTQYTAAQARAVGQAAETLTLHLKRLTRSLALVPTRPDKYGQLLLWERPAWDKFRKVMESLYSPEQLGEAWPLAREYNSYDHVVTPHLYETRESSRLRPVTHGPVFLAARRQVNLATNWRAPIWLSEGFAEYGDHVVHKVNRWYTIYDQSQQPPSGEWFAEARRLASSGGLRPWDKLMSRELRDWAPSDYVQVLGTVAFLLESEPAKFLRYLRQLAAGDDPLTALEQSYSAPRDELDQRCARWLLTRR
jgi:hypothetical protein